MFDTYHLWDTPTCSTTSRATSTGSRASTSPTSATRRAPRATASCPGDGVADLPRLLAALDDAGWDGFYDVEIFSDAELDGSLVGAPGRRVRAARGREHAPRLGARRL